MNKYKALIDSSQTLRIFLDELDIARIRLRQYENLRRNFKLLIDDVLGVDYYNEGMDVYTCDQLSCRDLKDKICKRNCTFRRK